MKVYECRALPLWVRIGLYALDHDGDPLARGELRRSLDPQATSADVSRGVRRAVEAGLLAKGSTARRLCSLVSA